MFSSFPVKPTLQFSRYHDKQIQKIVYDKNTRYTNFCCYCISLVVIRQFKYLREKTLFDCVAVTIKTCETHCGKAFGLKERFQLNDDKNVMVIGVNFERIIVVAALARAKIENNPLIHTYRTYKYTHIV